MLSLQMDNLQNQFKNGIILLVINLVKNRKILIIAVSITIVAILATLILLVLLNKKEKQKSTEREVDVEQLEIQFNDIFDNKGNEYISTLYHIEETKSGKYDIRVDIPYSHINGEIDNKINKELNDVFIKKLSHIINGGLSYTIFKMDYTTSINNDIVSLVVRCVLKEGSSAQRTIIKTYNYNIQTNEAVKIMDLIPENRQSDIQELINRRIQSEVKREQTIVDQGYNVYRRDPNSDIYILKNASEFYIADDILYIIYSYGNSNYTSKVDIIIIPLY